MKMLTKARNRVNDLINKATSLIKKEFPGAKAYVGKPFNDGARKLGRVWAQQVSQASNRKIINQLDYKMGGAIQIEEHYTSKTCPVCGVRKKSKHGRFFQCKECGCTAPRDVVGSVNIRTKGIHGVITSVAMPKLIKYFRPVSLGRQGLNSSGGHPASSSLEETLARSPQLSG